MNSNPCLGCGFNDPDFGCTCPSNEMWYACPLSPDPSPEGELRYKVEDKMCKVRQ